MQRRLKIDLPPISSDFLALPQDHVRTWGKTPKTAMSFWGEYGRSPRFNQVGKVAQVCQICLGVFNNVLLASMKTLAQIALQSEMELRAQYHLSPDAFPDYRAEPPGAGLKQACTW